MNELTLLMTVTDAGEFQHNARRSRVADEEDAGGA